MAGLVPAIPMLTSTALQAIGITSTRPVMTAAGLPVLDEPASQDEVSGKTAKDVDPRDKPGDDMGEM
jgi:hypothetical protein